MPAISLGTLAIFGASMVLQLLMIAMLPLSRGYTKPIATLLTIASMNLAIYLFALLIQRGVQLSVLLPISSALIPIGAIALGVFVFGEPAPWLKIILLVSASILVGVASGLK